MLAQLRQLLHRKPFQPIRVVMRDGKRYEIIDADAVAIRPPKAYAFVPRVTELAEKDIELVYVPEHLSR